MVELVTEPGIVESHIVESQFVDEGLARIRFHLVEQVQVDFRDDRIAFEGVLIEI